jgi:transcriptional regulator with XRE-family HTH domain
MLDTRKVLQENLKALLATRPETSRLNLSREMKVADGTLGSILYGTGNPTVEILEAIARFFELETWQLLSPELGRSSGVPHNRARSGHPEYWPFVSITPSNFNALRDEDRDEIEHQIAYKVKRLKENSSRKRKV